MVLGRLWQLGVVAATWSSLAAAQSITDFGTRFAQAIEKDQLETVRDVLAQGAPADTKVPGGTALMMAALRGRTKIVELLIENGADFKAFSSNSINALMWAAIGGSVPTLRLLVEKGADVNTPNAIGNTALIATAWYGKAEAADFLIHAGADLNHRNNGGATALIIAARNNHPAVARTLLERGANVTIKDESGTDVWALAESNGLRFLAEMLIAKSGKPAVLDSKDMAVLNASISEKAQVLQRALAAGGNPNARQPTGGVPAILYAALKGHTESLKLLIAKGADVNATNWAGATALMFAARDNFRAAELLLDAGADPNSKDETNFTPLMGSAHYGQQRIASLLIGHGADVNAEDSNGGSALMEAALNGDAPTISLLVDKGALINASTDKGNTPLMFAARKGNSEAVRLLLSKGADASMKANGLTAADMASAAGHSEVAALFLVRPPVDSNSVLADGSKDIEHPYAVLQAVTVMQVETVKNDGTRKWPPMEPLDADISKRLKSDSEARARRLGADEVIFKEAYTANEVQGGSGWTDVLIAGLYDGFSEFRYERSTVPGPGGVRLAPPEGIPYPLPGSLYENANPKDPKVERRHVVVAFAVKREQPGGHRPPSEEEKVLWLKAEESDAIGPYRAYLTRFPNGSFAALARAKLSHPPVTATVWIYRTDEFRPTIFVNGHPALRLGGGRYVQCQLPPGITSFAAGSKSEKPLRVELRAGDDYFLHSHSTWGGERLEITDEATARQIMQKLRPPEVRWVRDPTVVRLVDYASY